MAESHLALTVSRSVLARDSAISLSTRSPILARAALAMSGRNDLFGIVIFEGEIFRR